MKYLSSLLALLIAFGPVTATAAGTTDNTYNIGNGKPGNKALVFKKGSGAQPGVRWNESTGKVEFTNDGSVYKGIGSGSGGGGGGIVLNENPGIEDGLAPYAASSGAPAPVLISRASESVANANVALGLNSLSWTPTAAAQYLRGGAVTIPSGLGGKNCSISFRTKGGDANIQVGVWNVTTSAVVFPRYTLAAQADWSPKRTIGFTCPAAGSVIYPEVNATAAAATVYIDDFNLGSELIGIPVAQTAQFVGQLSLGGWSANFGSQSDPTASTTYTVTRGAQYLSAPSSNWAGGTLKVEAGWIYVVEFLGTFTASGGDGIKNAYWYIYNDVEGYSQEANYMQNSGSAGNTAGGWPMVRGSFVATTTGTRQVRLRTNGQTQSILAQSLTMNVYRYPSQSAVEASQGITVEQSGWKVDAIVSGGSPGLGGVVSALSTPEQSSLVLVPGARSAPVTIACPGAIDSTGTTCPANEQLGFSFTPPAAGEYEACLGFNHYMDTGANGDIQTFFQLSETGNTSQTIVQTAGKLFSRQYNSAGQVANGREQKMCGVFYFGDASRRTLRMFYTQPTFTTANQSQLLGDQGREFTFTVRRKVELADVIKVAPPVSALLSSQATTGERLERVRLGGSGNIIRQSGWLTGSSRTGAGNYTVTAQAGLFSAIPECVCSPATPGSNYDCQVLANSTTSINVTTQTAAGNALFDADVVVMCMGPR